MAQDRLIIATRGSKLALWQSEHVKARLEAAHPGLSVELLVLSTKGDRIQAVSLSKIGDKGLFTQELEEALRSGDADIAVHSLKDLPTTLEDGLALKATLTREDPRDLLISTTPIPEGLASLANGARLGTSSLRRRAQALALRPDLEIGDLRGNVDTRIEKLKRGEHDAIILAAAGMIRLGYADGGEQPSSNDRSEGLHFAALEGEWISAVGQGAVAIEGRSEDPATEALLAPLVDSNTTIATNAERAFMRRLEGGCQAPVAGFASLVDGQWQLKGAVFSLDGKRSLQESRPFDASSGVESAEAMADALLAAGADGILSQARQASANDNQP